MNDISPIRYNDACIVHKSALCPDWSHLTDLLHMSNLSFLLEYPISPVAEFEFETRHTVGQNAVQSQDHALSFPG